MDRLSEEQIDGIEAVSMDMSKAYIHAVMDRLPEEQKKIVFDRYHLMGRMGRPEGPKSPLTGGFIWLYSRENRLFDV